MRAVTYDRYGPPDILRLADVERSVRRKTRCSSVCATSATRSDCGRRSGSTSSRVSSPGSSGRAKGNIGLEFAGEVESVGSTVKELSVGDRVFGIGTGTNAEFVCVREEGVVARIPPVLTFEEAAAVADGALSAISLLRTSRLEKGMRILVYGASGSIGVAAVQVAKHAGARVTAVCPTKSVDLMRSLGADDVVDYLNEDFTKSGKTYDVILDAAGKTSFLHCRQSLQPDGMYVTTDPGFLWHDALISLTTKKAKLGIVRWTKADLLTLTKLIEAGDYSPVIDRTYPLEEVVAAHRYVETHQKTGNVVLTVR